MVMDNSSQRVYFNQNNFFKILRQQAIRQCLEGYLVPFAPISKFHHVRLISPTKKKKERDWDRETLRLEGANDYSDFDSASLWVGKSWLLWSEEKDLFDHKRKEDFLWQLMGFYFLFFIKCLA